MIDTSKSRILIGSTSLEVLSKRRVKQILLGDKPPTYKKIGLFTNFAPGPSMPWMPHNDESRELSTKRLQKNIYYLYSSRKFMIADSLLRELKKKYNNLNMLNCSAYLPYLERLTEVVYYKFFPNATRKSKILDCIQDLEQRIAKL